MFSKPWLHSKLGLIRDQTAAHGGDLSAIAIFLSQQCFRNLFIMSQITAWLTTMIDFFELGQLSVD